MHAALVVMAAGLGSRYGGVKQVEKVGPEGEILMEYAIYDALQAGFDRVVVVIKPEMYSDTLELFGNRLAEKSGIDLCFAFQRMEGDWQGLPIPGARTKPLGTVHALLSAREYLDRPFAVINADDYYGRESIASIGAVLPELRSPGDAVMVGYRIQNTVSPYGTVTRGVCGVEDGILKTVTETYKIKLFPNGVIRDTSESEDGPVLVPGTPVSMNLWGFHPEILGWLEARLERFLRELDPEDNKSECLLPVAVDELISQGRLRCRVLDTPDRWFGMTYPEDKAIVKEELRKLHEAGVYPPSLWG